MRHLLLVMDRRNSPHLPAGILGGNLSLSIKHPIADFIQIQHFNRAIENLNLLWLLRVRTLFILPYV